MEENEHFIIHIYHAPVSMESHVYGKENYRREVEFLQALTGLREPIPDNAPPWFPVDDEQFDAYLDFKRTLYLQA
jgi:hypothetical protein